MMQTQALNGSVVSSSAQATPPSKGLTISLWVLQVVLGGAFFMAGLTKLTQPIAALLERMAWVGAVPEPMVRFIAAAEALGAIGLIVPAVTRIKPGLTALAGAGLSLVMVLAAGFHATRGEFNMIPANLVLGGLAAFVAWGRFTKAPIQPR